MRMPWQAEKPPQSDDPSPAYDGSDGRTSAWDENDPAPEENAPEAPTLDVFDDEAKAVAEAYAQHMVAQARDAERARLEAMQRQAREAGFAVSEDSFGLADPNKAQQWVQPLVQGRPQPQEQPQAQAPAEAPDPEPDQYEDQAGWMRWCARQEAKAASQPLLSEIQRLTQENRQLTGFLMGREQTESAGRLEAAIDRFNPYLKPVLQHPDFGEAYQTYISGLSGDQMQKMNDPQFLAQVVGVVSTYLDPQRAPQQQQEAPRDTSGRFTSRPQALAQIQQAAAGASSSSRDAGPGSAAEAIQIGRDEERILRQLSPWAGGITRAQWAASDAADVNEYNARMAKTRRR